jgi:hypothetical protein
MFSLDNMKERDRLGDLDIDGRVILNWNLKKKWGLNVWTGFAWLMIGFL